VIVLLDGSPSVGYHSAFPLLARRFNRGGFNVATLVAPYHLQRRPRRPMEWNSLELAQAIAQNVAEFRELTGWLVDEGCPSVGGLGFSFGGWLAGLTVCSDTRIASVVLQLRMPLGFASSCAFVTMVNNLTVNRFHQKRFRFRWVSTVFRGGSFRFAFSPIRIFRKTHGRVHARGHCQ